MEAVLKSAVVTLDEPILADAAGGDAAPGEPELPTDATVVEPQDGVVDAIPHAIGGYALSADGLTLSAYYVGGVEDCYGLAEATADRAADGLVTVSIREGQLADVDGPCIEIGVAKVASITLDAAADRGGRLRQRGRERLLRLRPRCRHPSAHLPAPHQRHRARRRGTVATRMSTPRPMAAAGPTHCSASVFGLPLSSITPAIRKSDAEGERDGVEGMVCHQYAP